MRVSREQAEKNRAHVVEVASEQFRTHGVDGIGIADLMKQAGLTHGGFYANFASKDALATEALALALGQTADRLRRETEERPDALDAVVDRYLSPGHRDDPTHGCALPALAADSARHHAGMQQAMHRGIEDYLAFLTPLMQGETEAMRRQQAMATLAMMVGTLVLARAVESPLSDELLAAGRAATKTRSG